MMHDHISLATIIAAFVIILAWMNLGVRSYKRSYKLSDPPQSAPLPMALEIFKPQSLERYINLWFTRTAHDDASRVESTTALVPAGIYYLRVKVGPLEIGTILEEAIPFLDDATIEHAFPETKGKPVPLDVTVFSNDFEVLEHQRTQQLVLIGGRPTETIYFPLTAPVDGIARLRLCVFYRNHLLQSLSVSATVGSYVLFQPQNARVEMTFSADFSRVDQLPERALWLGLNESQDGSHTVHIKDTAIALSRNLEHQIENALLQTRPALREVSFDTEVDDEGKPLIHDDTGVGKRRHRF